MKLDLVIAGVGGQGNLLASQAIAKYTRDRGYHVFGTETIGAAQRGGSVVSHVRVSDEKIYSPLVPVNSADVLLGFEPIEALKNVHLINEQGKFVINVRQEPTILCNMGIDQYPELGEILTVIRSICPTGYTLEASQLAYDLGSKLMTNVVMMGCMTKIVDFFELEEFREILLKMVPAKAYEKNMEAFMAGYNFQSSPYLVQVG